MDGPGTGLRWTRVYPAEGDSALVELSLDDIVSGEARLEGIGLTEVGEARIAGVRVVLRLFPTEADERPLEFDLEQVQMLLAEARAWLLENEQGRTPLTE